MNIIKRIIFRNALRKRLLERRQAKREGMYEFTKRKKLPSVSGETTTLRRWVNI